MCGKWNHMYEGRRMCGRGSKSYKREASSELLLCYWSLGLMQPLIFTIATYLFMYKDIDTSLKNVRVRSIMLGLPLQVNICTPCGCTASRSISWPFFIFMTRATNNKYFM